MIWAEMSEKAELQIVMGSIQILKLGILVAKVYYTYSSGGEVWATATFSYV